VVLCRVRRRQDDSRAPRPPHPSLRNHRNRQRELALQTPRLSATPACPGGQTGTSHARRSVARGGTARRARDPPVRYRDEPVPMPVRGPFSVPIRGADCLPIDTVREKGLYLQIKRRDTDTLSFARPLLPQSVALPPRLSEYLHPVTDGAAQGARSHVPHRSRHDHQFGPS
jgi:hypothetical protein